MEPRRSVTVLGGGLAGMMAALELQEAGFQVTIIEKAPRLGGKAGSRDGDPECQPVAPGDTPVPLYEHGYHIFAPWYDNLHELLGRLEVPLEDVHQWHYLRPLADDKPIRTLTLPEGFGPLKVGWLLSFPARLASLARQLWRRILPNSPIPGLDTLLYFYFVLDMISYRLTREEGVERYVRRVPRQEKSHRLRGALDQVSRLGLLRNRWYVTSHLPELERESMLKATAIPVHEMSAFTAKRLSSYYLRQSQPPFRVLRGDLQTAFIEPFAAALTAAGVKLELATEVVRLSTDVETRCVDRVEVRSADGVWSTFRSDIFVNALPLDVNAELLDNRLYALDPELGKIRHLRAAPMAQLELHLRRPIERIRPEHTFLSGGRFGLSFVDQNAWWERGGEAHRLALIAANFEPIAGLSRREQFDALMEEITGYLPIRPGDVLHWNLHPNTGPGERLFINSVGSWSNRPHTTCAVRNLFFAGDWVRNPVDLACMEGAIVSGRLAASVIAGLSHLDGHEVSLLPGPKEIPSYPRWFVRGLVWAFKLPAFAVWCACRLRDRIAGGDRDAT